MRTPYAALALTLIFGVAPAGARPIGKPGLTAEYRLETAAQPRASTVSTLKVALGPVEGSAQWITLEAAKAGGGRFRIWLLSDGYPTLRANIARYLFEEGAGPAREFRHAITGAAVLPSIGGWEYLIPRGAGPEVFPAEVKYLGHGYRRESLNEGPSAAPPAGARVIPLRPDVQVGPPENTRQKDETRRYDESDYEMVPLVRQDYNEMAAAGINCVYVSAAQAGWAEELNLFYWGAEGKLPFPEFLYRSLYLGPALFLDEPAVGTRDYVIRARFAKDEAFRKAITPQIAFDLFKEHYREAMETTAPVAMMRGLAGRADVDLGDMKIRQENLYSWETMVSTYAHELSQDPRVPEAVVFEPPGRIGSARTIPEMNMSYGTQIPMGDVKALADIIFGFARGAARATGKKWGVSIYGSVQPADTNYWFTHAYDLGATRFHFWDSYRLACVPYGEVLALSRLLKRHASENPERDLAALRNAAEVAILLPPGYDLGHVHMGKGMLWGLDELNLERVNRQGVTYRTVMSNFFLEIERCLREGVAFDLMWDLPAVQPKGYRKVVRVREDGKVEVYEGGARTLLDRAPVPARPKGQAPLLSVAKLSAVSSEAGLAMTVVARVVEKSARVYYAMGADPKGVYHNAMAAFELYGPEAQDHRFLSPDKLRPTVRRDAGGAEVEMRFAITRAGKYRLRVATVDLAGRTTVVWKPLMVEKSSSGQLGLN